jgi:hypothetical protein
MSKQEESATPVWGTVNYVQRAYALPRFTIYQGIKDGSIDSHIVGATANKRGRRLILIASVERFITQSPNQISPKVRREMSKLGKAGMAVRWAAKLKRRRRVKGGK